MLNLGNTNIIDESDIVAILDLATVFESENLYNVALNSVRTIKAPDEPPKSLVILLDKDETILVYTPLNVSTIKRRAELGNFIKEHIKLK